VAAAAGSRDGATKATAAAADAAAQYRNRWSAPNTLLRPEPARGTLLPAEALEFF